MKKTSVFLCLISFFLFSSCGLETYVYLNPVENINSNINYAEIYLPSGQPFQFRNYIIYYRIYLSNRSEPTFATEQQINNVNTTLFQDYKRLDSYTANDNVSPTAIDTVFRNLGYYSLFISPDQTRGDPLDSVLNVAAGGTILLYFNDSQIPPLLEYPSGIRYYLFRANNFISQPTRLFTYSEDLANSVISNTVNTDLQVKTGAAPVEVAYVSMYIVAFGIDENYSPLYSRPTHIGIFLLP